ncbi:MAG: hypothetical protein AAF845_09130 [Bacteroidota bacterium]
MFRPLLLSLVALALAAAPANAQSRMSERGGPEIQQLGNFEIQDLMVSIRYASADGRSTRVEVTGEAPRGADDLVLVATAGRRTFEIPLETGRDGTLSGAGTLPTLGETDALAILVAPEAGVRFGIPVYDERQGWNIEQGSAWKAEEGETSIVGTREGNGWSVTISMDWPLDVDIVIEG